MAKTIEIKYEGKSFELPVIEGTENELAIDISKLRSETGLVTLDFGYKNTGSTISKITYLDGENGSAQYQNSSMLVGRIPIIKQRLSEKMVRTLVFIK